VAVVAFDTGTFYLRFPELAGVSPSQLTFYFQLAGDFVNNTDCSIVPYCPPTVLAREDALYLTVAHLAKLFGTNAGISPSPIVGRIDTATEGSVSVGATVDIKSQSAQWWLSSVYGFAVWQLLAPWRSALYISARRRSFEPAGVGGPSFGGVILPYRPL